MDVLIDLLPSVNQVKIANSKKDKRQRNKYNRQMNSGYSENDASKATISNESNVSLKQVLWTGVDRRSSVDRRQLKNKRGRWLESRARNDRRAIEFTISVKI